jgi:hypothetical protein
MTVGEIRDSLTNSQLTHYMAFLNLYPMGEEAMDHRFEALIARLEAGLAVVQVKRGKTARFRKLFKREFWTKPRSYKELRNKIITAFRGLGMEGGDE